MSNKRLYPCELEKSELKELYRVHYAKDGPKSDQICLGADTKPERWIQIVCDILPRVDPKTIVIDELTDGDVCALLAKVLTEATSEELGTALEIAYANGEIDNYGKYLNVNKARLERAKNLYKLAFSMGQKRSAYCLAVFALDKSSGILRLTPDSCKYFAHGALKFHDPDCFSFLAGMYFAQDPPNYEATAYWLHLGALTFMTIHLATERMFDMRLGELQEKHPLAVIPYGVWSIYNHAWMWGTEPGAAMIKQMRTLQLLNLRQRFRLPYGVIELIFSYICTR